MKKQTEKELSISALIKTESSRLPELCDKTFEAVKLGLDDYFDLKEGKDIDKDKLIERLALATHYAYEETEHWYKIALELEKQGQVNANIRGHNEFNAGVKQQRKRHSSNSSPFKHHEKLILKYFDEYQESLSSMNQKQTLPNVKAKIEEKTSLIVTTKALEGWRKNYLNSGGKTIFTK